MKTWTATAETVQAAALVTLAFRGAPIEPEQRFVRVLNAISAPLDHASSPSSSETHSSLASTR